MFWKTQDLRQEEAIRSRIARLENQLADQRKKLTKLHDKVHARNKRCNAQAQASTAQTVRS